MEGWQGREGKKRETMIADTAVSLFQGSLRSHEVPLICLNCKTWLLLQTMAVAKRNVTSLSILNKSYLDSEQGTVKNSVSWQQLSMSIIFQTLLY